MQKISLQALYLGAPPGGRQTPVPSLRSYRQRWRDTSLKYLLRSPIHRLNCGDRVRCLHATLLAVAFGLPASTPILRLVEPFLAPEGGWIVDGHFRAGKSVRIRSVPPGRKLFLPLRGLKVPACFTAAPAGQRRSFLAAPSKRWVKTSSEVPVYYPSPLRDQERLNQVENRRLKDRTHLNFQAAGVRHRMQAGYGVNLAVDSANRPRRENDFFLDREPEKDVMSSPAASAN